MYVSTTYEAELAARLDDAREQAKDVREKLEAIKAALVKERAAIEAAKAYRELRRSFGDTTTRDARADTIGVIADIERQLLDAIDALEAKR